MARIGMFCLPWTGHLNPFVAVADELVRRGHDITFFHTPEIGDVVRSRGFQFEAYGTVAAFFERGRGFGRPKGAPADTATDPVDSHTEVMFATAPAIIEDARLDLWVVDHLDHAAATLAACMRQPFVSLVLTLLREAEDEVPGPTSQPHHDLLSAYRQEAGLAPFSYDAAWSDLAQISQVPRELERPRARLPRHFHFTGPFIRRDRRPSAAFTMRRRPDLPLIYVSFGTVQNTHRRLYESVAKVAATLDADFVLSTGGESLDVLPAHLPANVTAATSVPQLEILAQADVMITHAGMNSTLECLAAGVPMVAVPIAYDQPSVSERIVQCGAGVRVPAQECGPARLRDAVATVLGDQSYRDTARRFQRVIAERDGPSEAAAIIERVLETQQPVHSS